jgi:DNA-binding XRE family transcriptional regulator
MAVARLNGARVRAVREVFNITRADLAKAVDVTDGYIGHIETGLKQPSPAVARRIVDHLLIAVDEGLITYAATDEAVA